MATRITVEPTRPSSVGPAAWSAIAGPWDIDYSYAGMRALELHPFNDSSGPRTLWWVVREDGRPVGMATGYVTETYNFATLFTFGPLRWFAIGWDAVYRALNRRGWYRHLERWNLALLLRVNAGRSRALFLITPTADVGGHVIGQALRDRPPATYLPQLLTAIEDAAAALGVEQVTLREVAEADAGPARYPNLWRARDARGRPILRSAGYSRNPGFPPAFVDLREVQACRPLDGNAIYAFYRHDSAAQFVAYETARRAWLAEQAPAAGGAGMTAAGAGTPAVRAGIEPLLRHPSLARRTDETRLHRFRTHLFRSGILPDGLVETAQLDRAEQILKSAPRTVRRLARLRTLAEGLERRIETAAGGLPAEIGGDVPALLRARRIGTEEVSGTGPPASVTRLVAAVAEEAQAVAAMDARFASLPSARRSTLVQLAAGRIRDPERERAKLARDLATDVARVDELIAIAAAETDRDRALRALRAEIAELRRSTGVAPEEAAEVVAAHALLAACGGALPDEVMAAATALASLDARRADVRRRIAAAESLLAREAPVLRRLLLGEAAAEVRDDLDRTRLATFRREQDRIATEAGAGRPPRSAEERRARLEAAIAHRPIEFARMLRDVESLRDSDRERIVREHEAHQAAIRAAVPDQPGPVPPAFDDEGYLASGLHFVPRDERVWRNLSDQDRITVLYHRTMANSLIRHDVEDWPYRAAYREAGRATGDELHISTLRAGGPEGPIVAAVSLKRSPAGHFRPERIAKSGIDFGAYYSLVLLVMAHELSLGGTLCSLGQTAQGTKLREFGATFIDVHQYTRFRGLLPRLLGFDLIRRAAFRRVRLDRILELAALPPEERRAAAGRHGFRWRF